MKYLVLPALALFIVVQSGVVAQEAESEEAPSCLNPNFSQDERDEAPEDDAEARKTLKSAYQAVYSPRAAGLESFEARLSVNVKAPEIAGQQIKTPPITVEAEIEWSLEHDQVSVELLKGENAKPSQSPLMLMLQSGVERALPILVPELMDGVIGMHSFDQRFENAIIVSEGEKQIRVWLDKEGGEARSNLVSVKSGQVASIDLPDMRVAFEYDETDDKVFVAKVLNTLYSEQEDHFGDLEVREEPSNYTLSERSQIGGYIFATTVTTDINYGGFPFHVVAKLSEIVVDDEDDNEGGDSEREEED